MIDIHSIRNQRVLLRVDLSYAIRFPVKTAQIIPTINLLLKNGCGVCIVTSLGSALVTPAQSSRALVEILSQHLSKAVKWLPSYKGARIELGGLYLGENTFMSNKDVYCDPSFVKELEGLADVVVFDTLKYVDANYASTQGLLKSSIPKSLGLKLLDLYKLHQDIQSSKVGLISGGQRVAWQLRLIRSMAKSLSFLAIGGELASVFAGKGKESSGLLQDEVIRTLAILRKEKVKVLYPVDVVAYSAESQRNRICLYQDLETEEHVYDLGAQSRNRILKNIDESKVDMVIMSGTIGNVLDPRYARSSEILINEIARRNQNKVLIGKSATVVASRLSVLEHYNYAVEGSTIEMAYLIENLSLVEQMMLWERKETVGV